MKVKISEPTLNNIINEYPHLNESMVEYLFFVGNLKRGHTQECKLNKYDYYYDNYIILHVPEEVAKELKISEIIRLVPDEEGVIYRIKIDE